MLTGTPSVLACALPLLPRTPPQLLPTFVLAVGFLQVLARPCIQLEVDADPMAPYMALSAAHVCPFPHSWQRAPTITIQPPLSQPPTPPIALACYPLPLNQHF